MLISLQIHLMTFLERGFSSCQRDDKWQSPDKMFVCILNSNIYHQNTELSAESNIS